jgi:hypothetical protein
MVSDVTDVEDAIAARTALAEFWAALAKDDDSATLDLFYGPSLTLNGFPENGLSEALRKALRVTMREAAGMAVSLRARRFDEMWAFASSATGGEPMTYDTATIVYWPPILAVIRDVDDGRWKVWGVPQEKQGESIFLDRLGYKPG